MMEALQFEFMRNALAAAVLASIVCGVIGVFVVVKRITFISGAVAHAAFGGIGLGYFLGINPLAALLPFSIISAVGMGIVSRKTKIPEDTSIGIFWAAGMALGVIFIGFTPGYTPDLFSYLFGNILTVTASDVTLMFFLDIVIIVFVICFYKEFLAISFDEEYARTTGVKVDFFYLLLLCLVALTVVVLIRIVGIILVIALLTIPAAIARQFNPSSLKRMMLISVILGIVFTSGGLWLSYALDIASGATIILLSCAGFLVSYFLRKIITR
ncbi:MAG: metal ABC transporter permease [Candidatus Omnitrophota bacterium]